MLQAANSFLPLPPSVILSIVPSPSPFFPKCFSLVFFGILFYYRLAVSPVGFVRSATIAVYLGTDRLPPKFPQTVQKGTRLRYLWATPPRLDRGPEQKGDGKRRLSWDDLQRILPHSESSRGWYLTFLTALEGQGGG